MVSIVLSIGSAQGLTAAALFAVSAAAFGVTLATAWLLGQCEGRVRRATLMVLTGVTLLFTLLALLAAIPNLAAMAGTIAAWLGPWGWLTVAADGTATLTASITAAILCATCAIAAALASRGILTQLTSEALM